MSHISICVTHIHLWHISNYTHIKDVTHIKMFDTCICVTHIKSHTYQYVWHIYICDTYQMSHISKMSHSYYIKWLWELTFEQGKKVQSSKVSLLINLRVLIKCESWLWRNFLFFSFLSVFLSSSIREIKWLWQLNSEKLCRLPPPTQGKVETDCNALQLIATHPATPCNTLQHTATPYITLQHAATHRDIL